MRIFAKGAAGFVGSTLVDRLRAEGHRVFGVDDLSAGTLTDLENAVQGGERFTFVRNDIQAPKLNSSCVICASAARKTFVKKLGSHGPVPASACLASVWWEAMR